MCVRRRVGKTEFSIDLVKDPEQTALWKNQRVCVSKENGPPQMNGSAEETFDGVNMFNEFLHRSDVEMDCFVEFAERAAIPVTAHRRLQHEGQVLIWRENGYR